MDIKKVMTVTAALAAGVVMAESIVSSSVVGYNKAETLAGENLYRVATFEAVGGTASTFTIGSISVGEEDFAWWNMDYIATVDPYGSQDQYYTWDPDTLSWYECDELCMINYEAPANDVTLPLNQAVIICSASGANLTFSGSVIEGDTELYGIAGDNTYTGNFTPATITLGDIVVGEADFAWWNMDYIATINLFGSQDQYYTWDPDTLSWYECDELCAIDYEAPANDVAFEPNMGLLFCTAYGVTLNIPSPL